MAPNAAPPWRGAQSRFAPGRPSTRGDSHQGLDLPTPSFALDVQCTSIPGAPNAVEFSGGVIGYAVHDSLSGIATTGRRLGKISDHRPK